MGVSRLVGAGTDRTRKRISGGPTIVLVRPQLAVNIGMCARAMANFGLEDLRLVAPREGWPRHDEHRDTAYAAASGGADVLDNAKVFPDVRSAVADLNRVFATTARERGQGKRVIPPVEAMTETAAAMKRREKVGILFGPERTGLDNEDISLADSIVTFPVNPMYASLNLAQAVLLVGYEWIRASQGDAPPFAFATKSPPAPRDMVISFFDYFEEQLEKNGFFRPEGKTPIMRVNLRNMIHRMQLTAQDVRTLRGALVRLVEGPRGPAKTKRRQRPPKKKAESKE